MPCTWVPSVSTMPGLTALTRILRGPSSLAGDLHAAERLRRLDEHPSDVVLARDVRLDREGPTAGRGDLGHDFLGPCAAGGVQGALVCGPSTRSVQRALGRRRAAGEARLAERFARAVAEGDLPASADAAALARCVAAVTYGLAVQATVGASADEFARSAQAALRIVPGSLRRDRRRRDEL